MQEGNNRNFVLAIVLSILVLVGWQFFFAQPQIDRAREEAAQLEAQTPAPPNAPLVTATPAAPAAAATRGEALTSSPRIPIETPVVSGSINLTGARIDDLHLDDYRQTVDPESDTVTLLNPANGPGGYYAEFGWRDPAGIVAVPGPTTQWTVTGDVTLTSTTPVTLTWDNGAGVVFSRTISVDEEYMFTITDAVTNNGAAPVSLQPFGRVERLGEPTSQGGYIFHEGFVGVFGDEGFHTASYGDARDDGTIAIQGNSGGWLGITDKYWATALIPEEGASFVGQFAHTTAGGPAYQANFVAGPVVVQPGASGQTATRLFAGAKQVAIVNAYDETGIDRFELLIDWGRLYFVTKPMFYLLDFFNRVLGNFGLAVLAVTVLVKLLFFPLANRSYVSMSAMRKLQPEMMALRERYKDDRVKQQQALMEMYKKEKINPIAGCWPVLVQIPVFFALYKVLYVTIEMRHAPFFGWIQDLSAPDPTSLFNLFGLLPFAVPAFLAIGVWPLIMGVTMWVQMRLNPTPPDPTQRFIFNWMPVLFTFMLAAFPAGLVIYWAWNNFLSILQQYLIMRRQGVEVDLFGNIAKSFRRKPADKPDPAKSG